MVKDNHWQAVARGGGTLAGALERGAAARGDGAVRRGGVARAARGGLRRGRDAAAGGQSDAGDGGGLGPAGARAPAGDRDRGDGGITLDNVRAYAEAGADFVSIGALTHSVRAADLAVEVRVLG